MNILLLKPSDVLFFKDGRPMSGSLSGSGASWPTPNVINAAIYAALRRSNIKGHNHRQSGGANSGERNREFGSVATAGPFPVTNQKIWWFPRPLDAQEMGASHVTITPNIGDKGKSHLSDREWLSATRNQLPPSKDNDPEPWMSRDVWHAYLKGENITKPEGYHRDDSFASAEHNYGIGIDRSTGAVKDGAFYSASYLRLRSGVEIGILAASKEKTNGDPNHRTDVISQLFPDGGGTGTIVVGGQQRVCAASRVSNQTTLPLPKGISQFTQNENGKYRVKWILLTPSIWPKIEAQENRNITSHPGGWLPNWIDPATGQVQLVDGLGKSKAKRLKVEPGKRINAQLVSSIVGKPSPITGWSLKWDNNPGGAKSTHLAAPAGSVYFFEADSESDAQALANALNWHGKTNAVDIVNRRSALAGEKGFGLGVCAAW